MVLTTFSIRIKKVYLQRAILITLLSIISFIGLKCYMNTIGDKNVPYAKLKSYRYPDLRNFFKKLKIGQTTNSTVSDNTVDDYSNILIGLDQVGDLDTLSKENYKNVKQQLLDEAQFLIDREPKFFNKVGRSVDHLELEFYMQYARDVENGVRKDELEPEWQWAKDISIVYTWINGTEEALMERKAKYNGGVKKADQRDRCIDELRFSLRSVYKYLPWHKGKIFIVSPGQTPYWLDTSNPRIQVVDQEDILPKYDGNGNEVNPTFNSFAIEWFLDKVPGVSEQFIQLNDEYFFRRPVHPSFFFFGGGEGYKNAQVVKESRSADGKSTGSSNRKGTSNKDNHQNRVYKRDAGENNNNNNDDDDDDDEYYVHGLKIDKDIREMVARELKDSSFSDKKRDFFLGKRTPQDVDEMAGAEEEEEVDEYKELEEKVQEEVEEEEVDEYKDLENNDYDQAVEGEQDAIVEYENIVQEAVGSNEAIAQEDDGEQPDNEDEGIGIIPKEKITNPLVLKAEEYEFYSGNKKSIARKEKLTKVRPSAVRYIYPNAAQHYRFPNLYLSDQFLAQGFGKARNANGSKRWITKFFGAMATTNACITEDLGHSTLNNHLEHAPYIWNRDLFAMSRELYGKYINITLSNRFRSPFDFIPPFANYHFLRNHAAQAGFEEKFDQFHHTVYLHDVDELTDASQKTRSVLKFGYHIVDYDVRVKILTFGSINDDPKKNARIFKKIIESETILFFNLNDDYNELEAGRQLRQFMEFFFPEPSIFELPGTY